MEREKRVPMSVCERGGPRSVGSATCALASYYNCTNATSDLNCYKDCWFPESPRTTRMSRAQQNAWEGGQTLSYILYVHHLYQSLQKPSCVHSKKKKAQPCMSQSSHLQIRKPRPRLRNRWSWHLPLVNTTSKNMLFPLSIQPATKIVLSKRHLQKEKKKNARKGRSQWNQRKDCLGS